MNNPVLKNGALQLLASRTSSLDAVTLSLLLYFFFFRRLLLSRKILRGVGVVTWGRVGCGVVLGRFGVVVISELGVVSTGSIRSHVLF
jgi:hypothetical protein